MSHARSPRLAARGYTLIELLIVVGILGLAGAMLVPHLVDRDSYTAQAATRQAIADLHFAQSDALAHQGYRRVHFYDDGRGYCLLRVTEADYAAPFDEATADYMADPLGSLDQYVVDFTTDDRFEGVTISGVDIDSGGIDLVYDPLGGTVRSGGLPGTGGSFSISTVNHEYRITIAPFTGKLTVTTVR